jgi:hypothetical protein
MSDALVIETGTGASLGSPDEVLARLSAAFPETTWDLLYRPEPAEVPPNGWRLRLMNWLWNATDMQFPRYEGFLGWAGGFWFPANAPVERLFIGAFSEGAGDQARLKAMLDEAGWVSRLGKQGWWFGVTVR